MDFCSIYVYTNCFLKTPAGSGPYCTFSRAPGLLKLNWQNEATAPNATNEIDSDINTLDVMSSPPSSLIVMK